MNLLSRGIKTVVFGMGVCFAGVGAANAQTEWRSNVPIIINDNVPATPYPSTVFVDGLKRPVARVTVQIRGLSHTFPGDLGFLLVSPTGRRVVLYDRCGGSTNVSNITVNFDDDAPTGVPTPLVAGTYRPTTCSASVFAAPAPGGGFNAPLSDFAGDNGNGTWRLFVEDFALADVGQIAGGFSIFITEAGGSETFRNTGLITIRDNNTATPYPSNIVVSGMKGDIASVAVRLHDFSHTFPSDVGMLLVGPNGQKMVLMNERGDGNNAVHLELAFADTAPPPPGVWVSGTFHPSNDNPGFNFAAPAPGGPYAGSFATFRGAPANGTWSLYVQDHVGIDSGTIAGGWDLEIYLGARCRADFNDDGVVNSQDFFDFVNAFFLGCP